MVKTPTLENLSEEVQNLYNVTNEESDLGCVLIGTSYLEKVLATVLEHYFISSNISLKLLNPSNGVLGTFSSRADICYCLGLIPKGLYQNLCTIGEIRNLFAHNHFMLRFTNDNILELVNKLTFPRACGIIVENGKSRENIDPFSRFKRDSRNKFNLIIVLMVNHFIGLGHQTQHRPQQLKGWE